MKKQILIPVLASVIIAGGILSFFAVRTGRFTTTATTTKEINKKNFVRPDIVGVIQFINGNKLTIKVFDLASSPFGDVPREQIREQMRKLTQEERRAMRDKMEQSVLETREVIIPLETPISIGRREAETEMKFDELKSDMHVRIWIENKEEELPKAKKVQAMTFKKDKLN